MAFPRGISGNQGSALAASSNIAELTKWTYDEDLGIQNYVATDGVSGGIGYNKTVQGNTKAEGTLEGMFDPNASTQISAQLQVGSIITLVLYAVKPTNYYSFNARITKMHREADINSGAIQPFSASYVSDGPIAKVGV